MRIILMLIVGACFFASCQKDGTGERQRRPLFTTMDPVAAGIDFRNDLQHDESFNIYLFKSFYNGAGVGMGDFNNDGLQDVFFCGNQTDNRLYLNRGAFSFEDATKAAGVASAGSWSTGVSIVDVNGDGWQDIYVCKSGKPEGKNRHNELFINTGQPDAEGRPSFVESAAEYGVDDLGFSVHAAFFDYDRDGDLDMYLLNNSINPSEVILDARKGLREIYDEGGGNKLYRNDGKRFTDVTRSAGIYGSAIGFGLGVGIGDLNRDGWQDIYVANDFFEKDYLYLNNQDGTFTEALESVVDEISLGSMGVDIADINNDGYPDIFVTEMLPESNRRQKTKAVFDSWDTYALKIKNGYYRQFPRNALQLNRGRRPGSEMVAFSEISRLSGVAATDWSWGVQMLDLDNDGSKELFITNGIVKDLLDQDYIDFYNDPSQMRKIYEEKGEVIKELIDNIPSEPIHNYLYKKEKQLRYRDVSGDWGLGTPAFSTGAAFGDLDNDGDLDLLVNNLNGAPFLYRNESRQQQKHQFLNIRLNGVAGNPEALGAQVTLQAGGQTFFQELLPTRGTMSTIDKRLNFGLGDIAVVDTLVVQWPGGAVSSLYNVPAGQFLEIDHPGDGRARQVVHQSPGKPLMQNISEKVALNYRHRENEFTDFDRDRLLYHGLSAEGPGMAAGDVDGDGYADVYIGGAAGSAGALFVHSGGGNYTRTNTVLFEKDKASEDTDAAFADIDGDGDQDLLVASGGYEFSPNSFALANRIYLNDGQGNFSRSSQVVPATRMGSTSCIKPADYDGDGDVDLFIGSRVVPMQYGVPAGSHLFQNDGAGHFTEVTATAAPGLQEIGMVTGAVWTDYDQDGDQDLAVAGEWMAVRLLENSNGRLVDVSEHRGLDHTQGFWNTVTAADLDGDGDEELIAGNLGTNTFLQASEQQAVTMHINDFDGNGDIDHVLSAYNGDQAFPLAPKKEISKQMPFLLKKYLKYKDYSDQTVEDIFTAEQLENSLVLRVETTASMVFWNEEGHYNRMELPVEAQLAPVYAILADDVSGDGKADLLLGGNLHMAKPQTGIYAASQGVFLLGMGKRGFRWLPSGQSGFFVRGEIRSLGKVALSPKEEAILVGRSNDELEVFKYENEDQ